MLNMMRMFVSKTERQTVTGDWRKLCTKIFNFYYQGRTFTDYELDAVCKISGKDMCIENICREIEKSKTIGKT